MAKRCDSCYKRETRQNRYDERVNSSMAHWYFISFVEKCTPKQVEAGLIIRFPFTGRKRKTGKADPVIFRTGSSSTGPPGGGYFCFP